MKYLIVLTDGASGDRLEVLGNKTTLESADMPNIDFLAERGETGMVRTIPDGEIAGSDTGNLSVLGYPPEKYLVGRSSFEAAAMGIKMSDTDVSFRASLITVSGDDGYESLKIKDHSAGDISTEEATVLIDALKKEFDNDEFKLYPGLSYRHCLIWHNGSTDVEFVQPHNSQGRKVGQILPSGTYGPLFVDMMKRSYEILKDHPVNKAREEKGLLPANTLWIWGEATKPSLPPYKSRYGVKGTIISAVDLVKGIGMCAGLDVVDVPGATGNVNTNYAGKKDAAIAAYENGSDFVYIHFEGPDECGHHGDIAGKVEALERIDGRVVGPLVKYLSACGDDYRIMVLSDHRTGIISRSHGAEPVPYVIYDSTIERSPEPSRAYNETAGGKGGYYDSGQALADHFFRKG